MRTNAVHGVVTGATRQQIRRAAARDVVAPITAGDHINSSATHYQIIPEHVESISRWWRAVQRLFRRPWAFAADGCQLNRDIASALRRAGFASSEYQALPMSPPVGWLQPHTAGFATR